jgi:dCTP diphosphatase
MFLPLLTDLKQFVEERNWLRYHSPKNMATTLCVEATELFEHFLEGAKLPKQELENELGDLLHCILLTMDALKLSPPETIPEYKSSHPPILELSQKLRTFMSHFLWLRDDEPYRGDLSELSSSLNDLLALHFLLCISLSIDPFKATYHKLELNKKKYPTEMMKDSVDSYFSRKKALLDNKI